MRTPAQSQSDDVPDASAAMVTRSERAPAEDGRAHGDGRSWYTTTVSEALQAQGVDPASGLSDEQAAARLSSYGQNRLSVGKAESKWRAFARQYRDPMQIVLLVAGAVSLFLPDQFVTGLLLLFLTLFNAVLGLNQEGKAEASVAALEKMLIVKARVTRGGSLAEIDSGDLVPGDVVSLAAGDLVPADGRITGEGYSTSGLIQHVGRKEPSSLDEFLLPMALASDAVVRDGKLVGDPTEGALVVLAAKGGLDPEETRKTYPRLAQVPFDARYKLMATFHSMDDEDGREVVRCFVKGAPDHLLERAGWVRDPDGKQVPVELLRSKYVEANEELGKEGLRVIAAARKDFDPARFDPSVELLAQLSDLILVALVGILDPPRPEAAASIAKARAAGIQVRMITGDHAVTWPWRSSSWPNCGSSCCGPDRRAAGRPRRRWNYGRRARAKSARARSGGRRGKASAWRTAHSHAVRRPSSGPGSGLLHRTHDRAVWYGGD
jgi:magnesium-transporting ATPase (P-type)